MVRAVCHRIVLNRADAEDATQAALISIVRALPRFDGRAKFSTWAYRIAVNAALDEVRRIRRRPMAVGDTTAVGDLGPPLAGDDAGSGESAVESRMVVQAALALVPEEYRVVLVLRHIADLDYADIAVALDIPVGTVRSRLSRGREQLAHLLGNPDGTGERQNVAHTSPADPADPRGGEG
jgi:RNA polymerase sigma-70 factor (ECF subfamily)